MHLGFTSMNTASDPDPAVLAKVLEQAGFESLWFGEHSHIPRCRTTPYPPGGELPGPYRQMMDPYISLMAAAAATTTLKLGTGIALLMERELISQAKTIVTLERLSGSRLLIGTGVGWNREEFENVSDLPWQRRYSALRETVAATRTLFREASAEFHGEYINFDPVWFEPKPLAKVPVIFGAMGPVGMRHAAEWADGWMPVDVALGDVKESIAGFHRLLEEFGRRPEDVEITLVIMGELSADLLKYYRDCGVSRCNVGVSMENWEKPELIMPLIEEYSAVIEQLR
ncbi:TIGR03619 family F420-dependent LLM class oxidoreductase [Spongiibacter sp. KMU-166]|uniref:TIGR03619 family F420-dependent LLM class oxidoreductase n=2 Tax=Spongiibacter thalassae TaxID=2721624 RepID=A0ABX1GJV1_9GAMM|nr:TIGR03619 family F420-dependent LLM class oxidoreductase [Spongiibacter thalassae]